MPDFYLPFDLKEFEITHLRLVKLGHDLSYTGSSLYDGFVVKCS